MTPSELLAEENAIRSARRLAPREFDPALVRMAEWLANEMARTGEMSHELGGGLSVRAASAGWRGMETRENIAMTSGDESPYVMWMNSPGHRANILDADSLQAGNAVANGRRGTYFAACYGRSGEAGQSGGGGWWSWLWRLFR